jgi:DNA mismatch repair protein MutL
LTREFYGQQTASQILALPIQVNVSPTVKNAESEWLDFLQNIGFAIEEFGPRSYAVKAIPAYMTDTEAVGFINDFFDSLDEPSSFKDRKRADKIITHACKSAVKANDRLDAAEITQLIKDLALCDNPFSCPHGRPTVIRMKKSEIETLFKR